MHGDWKLAEEARQDAIAADADAQARLLDGLTALRACPFCGGTDTLGRETRINGRHRYWVECALCGARGPEGGSRKVAQLAWQERDSSS